MDTEKIITTADGDRVYINNRGKAFLLVEAYGFDGKSYDIVIAKEVYLYENNGIHFDFYTDRETDISQLRCEWFYGASDFCGDKHADDALKVCKEELNDEHRELFKPDVFYTGGGFWLSAMWIDDIHYYCISGYENHGKIEVEFPNCLPLYDSRGDDDDTEFGTMELVSEKGEEDFTETDCKCYEALVKALKETAF